MKQAPVVATSDSHFTAEKVKAVAEQCWWAIRPSRQIPVSERILAASYNLTVEQVKALRATPEYKKCVFTLMLGQRQTLKEFERWIQWHRKQYGDMGEFARWMGLDPKSIPAMVEDVCNAYAEIAAGTAKAPKMIGDPYKYKVDPSQPKIIGSGDESVYLYYFPSLPTYKRSSELGGETTYWRCNIGSTKGDVAKRVVVQCQFPERPRIALIMRTDDCTSLETKIHTELKRHGLQLDDAVGEEWFLTNPAEVLSIFESIEIAKETR